MAHTTSGRDRATGEARSDTATLPPDGLVRAVVEDVSPVVDGGRFAVKRIVGDTLIVEADAFADGHDVVVARLLHGAPGADAWVEVPMTLLGNDRWRGGLPLDRVGDHSYVVAAWTDRFATWRRDMQKRIEARQDVATELLVGAELVLAAAARAADIGRDDDAVALRVIGDRLRGREPVAARARLSVGDELAELMTRHPDRRHEARSLPFPVTVDPVHARFSSWYELFPRSAATTPGRHGTLRDVIERLDYVAGLGFDVLYLPPIHPIGHTNRKGPNNVTSWAEEAPGVPWAIGDTDGGHTGVHRELGTLDDVDALVAAAGARGIRVALDIAFQASPDHPYATSHPEWFRRLPDGTIRYAENPPKKYEDIYPFDFETEAWPALWQELRDVIVFWIGHGIRVFRVDNPHTKPFGFWEWLIADVKRTDPDIVFLAEAFTRPKVMYRLAKLGFSQGYTYFTWRTTKQELTDYFTELSRPPVSDRFRPNVWPNTPDILHEYLQHGGRTAFAVRAVLAATLAASYGIYGPAFELAVNAPREPGSEEYLDSEKYEVRAWDLDDPRSLAPLIRRLNAIRQAHPALQADTGLAFHEIDNDELLAYSKRSLDGDDLVLTVVNLDARRPQSGSLELPLGDLGIEPTAPFEVRDLLTGNAYLWNGARNWIELDPATGPAHVFEVRRRIRRESDLESYA
ncbi:MAG: alpha-1,4-glucan--maltose-1-phosphate maltosyltransferase [Chloroflexota bacterium]